MKRRLPPTLPILGAFVLLMLPSCAEEPPPPPPPKVQFVTVEARDVPEYLEAVGQTVGSLDINVRARVEGILEEIHFDEGTPVEKDQLLYTIDTSPFDAQLQEAIGRLAEAQARYVSAEADLKRIRPLVEINALSRRTLDQAIAEFDASKGLVDAANGTVERARIQLSYCEIRAPIKGLIGLTQAKPGDYVGSPPNPVVLATISRLDPIHVRFSISEREYLEFARRSAELELDPETGPPEERRAVELFLADGTRHDHVGRVDIADRQINPETGTLLLEASFPNPERILRPGQFARVRSVVDIVRNAPVIPQRCVQELQGIHQVYVVSGGNEIEARRVTMGQRIDHLWQVLEGLHTGERVVYEGLLQVRPGVKVEAVPATTAPPGTDGQSPAKGSGRREH